MRLVRVVARVGEMVATNVARCAERHLLARLRRVAARRGVPARAMGSWAHRKWGALRVERTLATGAPTCSLPCPLCRRAMARAGVPWVARDWDGNTVTAVDAPPARLTSGQKTMFASFRRCEAHSTGVAATAAAAAVGVTR